MPKASFRDSSKFEESMTNVLEAARVQEVELEKKLNMGSVMG